MNNGNISFYSIAILLFTILLSSYLEEPAVPIETTFAVETSEYNASSVMIQLKYLKLLRVRVKVILNEVMCNYISYHRAKDIILCANMRYITYQNDID